MTLSRRGFLQAASTGLILAIVLYATAPARADVADPQVTQCDGKEVGAACEDGGCVATRCSRSRPGPDGKLETSEWDCVRCVAGAPVTSGGMSRGVKLVIGALAALPILGLGIWLARRRRSIRIDR